MWNKSVLESNIAIRFDRVSAEAVCKELEGKKEGFTKEEQAGAPPPAWIFPANPSNLKLSLALGTT